MTSIRFVRIALAVISLLAASALAAAVDHFGFEELMKLFFIMNHFCNLQFSLALPFLV